MKVRLDTKQYIILSPPPNAWLYLHPKLFIFHEENIPSPLYYSLFNSKYLYMAVYFVKKMH